VSAPAPQSPGEIEAVKRAVRERDGMRCVSCGMSNAEHLERYGRILDVHRLTPGSLYAVDETCQTLCRPCHGPQPRRKAGEPDLAWGDRASVMSVRPPDDLRRA
jgi:5-methylcytosine-specific restriction endonuclease McrA